MRTEWLRENKGCILFVSVSIDTYVELSVDGCSRETDGLLSIQLPSNVARFVHISRGRSRVRQKNGMQFSLSPCLLKSIDSFLRFIQVTGTRKAIDLRAAIDDACEARLVDIGFDHSIEHL